MHVITVDYASDQWYRGVSNKSVNLSGIEHVHVRQGEVVTLANKALQSLCARGTNVLLEGRSQTVNYIRQ